MRLLVVAAAPPESSFSTWPKRRIVPQPPGPGVPLHAPSVKISTSGAVKARASGVDAISRRVDDAAMEAQFFGVFERVLWPHQRAFGLVLPVIEPGQQETQRAAARQQGEGGDFRRRQVAFVAIMPDQQ